MKKATEGIDKVISGYSPEVEMFQSLIGIKKNCDTDDPQNTHTQ